MIFQIIFNRFKNKKNHFNNISSAFFLIDNLDSDLVPIYVVVKNSLLDTPAFIYTTHVATRGILLGALKRLMHSNADFK